MQWSFPAACGILRIEEPRNLRERMRSDMKERISLGFIGLGARGGGLLEFLLLPMEDVDIPAVCDLYEDRREKAAAKVTEVRGTPCTAYADYRDLLAHPGLDGVIIATSWQDHVPIAIAAMRRGLYTAFEVGGAYSLDQCWQLVHTLEETGVPCMMLENCCYGRDEMMALHMARLGVFGELVHCQGGYEHDLRDEVALGKENRHYRLDNYSNRNGEIYPTHELGPIAKLLNIHKGNRLVSLTSMASKAVGLHSWIAAHKSDDADLMGRAFTQGDVVTTMIKCAHGETILLIHDTTLPRPYSRGLRIQGTKGAWMEDNHSLYIEGVSEPHTWEPTDKYRETYEHPLWKDYQAKGVRGGHDGMDYLVFRAFVESVKNGTGVPIDIYDAAAWMAVTCLSEESIALGGAPVAIPDFTGGRWIHGVNSYTGPYDLQAIPDIPGV